MKYEKGWIRDRLRQLLYKIFSLSFLSWVAVFVAIIATGTKIGIEFLGFTAAVIGLKSYFRGENNDSRTTKD